MCHTAVIILVMERGVAAHTCDPRNSGSVEPIFWLRVSHHAAAEGWLGWFHLRVPGKDLTWLLAGVSSGLAEAMWMSPEGSSYHGSWLLQHGIGARGSWVPWKPLSFITLFYNQRVISSYFC